MPLSLRRGTVTAVRDQVPGLARIEVDGMPCVAYIDVTGPVEEGDDVLVNVQARELGLGSGGFDVLHANLSRGLELPAEPGAHVMKLPYTPIQFAVRHGEEDGGLPETLGGVPVAYVQVPGGALPLALSDTVRSLRSDELLHLTIGAGACFGGDADAVNVHSALALAVARGAEAVVASIGPGIVGTATRLGHGGVAAAEALAAAAWLGGRAVPALRISEHDPRERHRGVSHHTDAVLSLSGGSDALPWPEGCPVENPAADGATVVDVSGWRDACAGLPLSHMGRGPDDDPWFFAAAFAAGRLARGLAA